MKNEDDFDQREPQFETEQTDGPDLSEPGPESQAEANRKSGLAYGAVTLLIGAILIFLAVGWGIDKFFQTAPWGIVVGIIFGSIVGFYQFIRISSQID